MSTYEFYYFPIHARGLLPRMLMAHIDTGDDTIKHTNIEIKEFFANRDPYSGPFKQLPCMKAPDGTMMGQTNAICRFLAKKYKGKDGSVYYPGSADPKTTYWIDQFIDQQDSWFMEIAKFTVQFLSAYKTAKDENFVNYITKLFPARLEKIEYHLGKHKHKWLCADHPTLADFAMGVHIIRIAYNDKYEYEHIIRAVMENYPLTKAWAENFRDYTKEWWTTEGNSLPVNY